MNMEKYVHITFTNTRVLGLICLVLYMMGLDFLGLGLVACDVEPWVRGVAWVSLGCIYEKMVKVVQS